MTTPIAPTAATPLPNGFTLIRPGTLMEHLVSGERRPRPDLHVRDLLDQIGAEPRDSVPGYSLYGGATVTEVWDAAGARYTGSDARDPSGWFGFHVFKDSGAGPVNVPLQSKCTGRGSVNPNAYNRLGEWIAWEGSYFFNDVIPGFVAFAAGGGAPSPSPSGGSVYTACIPFRQHAAYNGVQLADGPINMHTYFGVPSTPIKCYNVRFVVVGDTPGIRGRLGPDVNNPLNYSENAEVAGVEAHGVGVVNAGADGNLYYSAVNGRPTVWIHLLGWWT